MLRTMGLYYPVIGFKDDAWVKLSALYWDKLGRILPHGHEVRDSDTVRQLTEELGFIKNFAPSDKEVTAVSNMFLMMLTEYRKKLLQEKLRDEFSFSWPSEFVISDEQNQVTLITAEDETSIASNFLHYKGLQGNEELDPKLAYILSKGKISNALTETLIRTELAVSINAARKDGKHVNFIGMHPKLAFVYMEVLAEQMAANRQLYPVTDNVLDHLAVSGYSLERLTQTMIEPDYLGRPFCDSSPSAQEIEVQMATIALRSVLPRDLANVPTKKIVQLRKKHRDELTAFQTYIHDFVDGLKELQDINDLEALKAHLEVEYDKRIKQQIDDLKKCLKSLAIDTVAGVFNVRAILPALIASTGIHLNPTVGMAGAVAFSVFPVIRAKRQEADQKVHSTPSAYLLYAKEGLEPATIASQVAQSARKFILDK